MADSQPNTIRLAVAAFTFTFAATYIVMRPVANALIGSGVSALLYDVVVWGAMAVIFFSTALFVAGGFKVRGLTRVGLSAVAAVASALFMAAAAWAVHSAADGARWAYTETASVAWMAVFAAGAVVISTLAVKVFGTRSPA